MRINTFLKIGLGVWILLVSLAGCIRKELVGDRESRDLRITNPYRAEITIPFDLVNNLVVIPLNINDSDPLFFILDTGVSRNIITELAANQEFTINYDRDIELRGLGSSSAVPALISSGNSVPSLRKPSSSRSGPIVRRAGALAKLVR